MSEADRFPALVTAVKDGLATVRVDRPSPGCGRCHEPGGCGGGLMATDGSGRAMELRVPNSLNSAPGDRVSITLPRPSLLMAALPGYGGAALLVIAGAAAGTALFGTDQAAVTGALLGMILGGLLFRWNGRRLPHPLMGPPCAESQPVQPCHSEEAT